MNTATRLRQAGRSWSEIRDMTGLTVSQAKEEVAADKREIRNELAHSPRNEEARGLNDLCQSMIGLRLCRHPRRQHVDGECAGCRGYANRQEAMWGRSDTKICAEFEEKS